MCSYITCYTLQLFLTQILCTAQNNGIGIFDLIIKELTKVFHIHTAFLCIRNRRKAIHTNFGFFRHSLYRSYYIRQLTDTAWLNDDTLRMIFRKHLLQCLRKISNQRTTDTAGIHFPDFDSCIL